MTREYTNKLIEAMDNGVLSPRVVADMALAYMSEFEVHDMVDANDLGGAIDIDDEDDEYMVLDEDDGYSDLFRMMRRIF